MNGEQKFVRLITADHFGKGSDRKIIMLRGHGELLLCLIQRQISLLKDLILSHQLLCIGEEFPPGIREDNTLIGTFKDENAEFIFQFHDAAGKCRLRHIQLCRRLAHGRRARNRQYIFDLIDIHMLSLLSFPMRGQ